MRSLLISILVTGLFAFTALGPRTIAQAVQSGMTVRGGNLPHEIEISPIDATAFTRRINDPPEFDEPPSVSGPTYEIETPYWTTIELDREDDEDDSPLSSVATYYSDSGVIQALQGSKPVWLVIDPRQRAIVDRYIRLGEMGLLSTAPSTLEVLSLAAVSEQITLDVAGATLSSEQTDLFWTEAANLSATHPQPGSVPVATPNTYWLVVTLREGRSVQFLYDPTTRSLIDQLGSEKYSVSAEMAELLGSNRGEPTKIENEASTGSPLWWVLMLGGGGAAIVLAGILQRRWTAPRVS